MQTHDDRGNAIRAERLPRKLLNLRAHPSKVSAQQLHRDQSTRRLTSLVLGGVMIGGFVAYLVPGRSMAVLSIPIITLVLIFPGLLIAALRQERIDAFHHLPRCGWCPACGHSLQGLTAEADGCHVCPECGGAWQRA